MTVFWWRVCLILQQYDETWPVSLHILKFFSFLLQCESARRDWQEVWHTLENQISGYAKFYSSSEHLSVDEIIVFFKQYISLKHVPFWYKGMQTVLHDQLYLWYTHVLGRDRQNVSEAIKVTHAILKSLSGGLKGGKPQSLLEKFCPPAVFDDPHATAISRTVAQNSKCMLWLLMVKA